MTAEEARTLTELAQLKETIRESEERLKLVAEAEADFTSALQTVYNHVKQACESRRTCASVLLIGKSIAYMERRKTLMKDALIADGFRVSFNGYGDRVVVDWSAK